MDLISAKHNAHNDDIDTLRALCDIKSQMDEIPVINDSELNSRLALLQQIHDCVEKLIKDNICKPLIEMPNPLPPFKPDDVNLEKLEWIMPPIPVKPEDDCRKENCNDTRDQKE